jgi:thioredoxin-like negative regulator of GroEL
MEELIIVAVIVAVWYLAKWYHYCSVDGFSGRPDENEIKKRINQMLQHQETFVQNMYKAREKMPWIDAIIYEEARAKLRQGQFNYNNLTDIFR